jgi:hypothetical protein
MPPLESDLSKEGNPQNPNMDGIPASRYFLTEVLSIAILSYIKIGSLLLKYPCTYILFFSCFLPG